MRNETELANFALMTLGAGQIQSINDSGQSAVLCSTWIRQAVRMTLALGEYQSTLRRVSVPSVGNPINGWSYRYAVPNDFLRLVAIIDSTGLDPDTAYDWELEGEFINCDVADATLKYVAEPTNVSYLDDFIASAAGYRLAIMIGPGLGMEQESQAIREVERRLAELDGAARTLNSRNKAATTRTRLWTQAGRT